MALAQAVERFERWQQRHRVPAVCVAVLVKFSDDNAGRLAATIAFYGFLSLFPLLLALLSLLGFALSGDPGLQRAVLDSAVTQIPVVGHQLESNVTSLRGSRAGVAVGFLLALWAGLGVTLATQNALNDVWDVPQHQRPDFLRSRLRGLLLLLTVGTGTVLTTVVVGFITGGALGALGPPAGTAASLVLYLLLFLLIFRALTARGVHTRELLPGVFIAAIAWDALRLVGSLYVSRVISDSSQTYGAFALVLGLLAWLYLAARIVLLSAEINVVLSRRLWPRSLSGANTPADRRALTAQAQRAARADGERVEVHFDSEPRRPD